MKRFILTLTFLLLAVSALAQQPNEYRLNIVGASSSTYTFASSTVTCNLSADPGSPGVINPRYLVWDDPVNSGRACSHDTGANTGPLFALPIGDYTATLVAVVSTPTNTLQSPPSNPVNFSRLVQPAARTGFRVRGAS